MNREDMAKWDGVLKGMIAAEGELEDAERGAPGNAKKGMKMARTALRKLRRKVERLHGEDLREFLRRY